MKSLRELIDEITREASGEDTGAEEPPSTPRGEVSEADFDIELDVDIAGLRAAPAQAPPRPAFPAQPMPEEVEPAEPRRGRTIRRRRVARGFRRILIVLLAAAVGTGAGIWFKTVRQGGGPRFERGTTTVGTGVEQDVVVWALHREEPEPLAFILVAASGGDRAPAAVAIPGYTYATVPGYGEATVGDATGVDDPELVAGAVEVVLGVKVDASALLPLEELAPIVDAVGGIEIEGRRFDGAGAISYLERGADDLISAEFQFLRWREVAGAVLAEADRDTTSFIGLPNDVAQVLTRAGTAGVDLRELPVEDIGAGLAVPDAEAVRALVAELFQSTARVSGDVRLVVLNGVGTPGIGDRVARVLVPRGFRLVSSVNAPSFDVEETQIVAANRDLLDEAEVARELLGVGKVFLGEQPTQVADVTVVIGRDFAST